MVDQRSTPRSVTILWRRTMRWISLLWVLAPTVANVDLFELKPGAPEVEPELLSFEFELVLSDEREQDERPPEGLPTEPLTEPPVPAFVPPGPSPSPATAPPLLFETPSDVPSPTPTLRPSAAHSDIPSYLPTLVTSNSDVPSDVPSMVLPDEVPPDEESPPTQQWRIPVGPKPENMALLRSMYQQHKEQYEARQAGAEEDPLVEKEEGGKVVYLRTVKGLTRVQYNH